MMHAKTSHLVGIPILAIIDRAFEKLLVGFSMFSLTGYQLQVFNSVVISLVIDMMNYFAFAKRTAKVFFHHQTMLINIFSFDANSNIAEDISKTSAFPSWVFFSVSGWPRHRSNNYSIS